MLLHVFCKRSGQGSLSQTVDMPEWHDEFHEGTAFKRKDIHDGYEFEVIKLDSHAYPVMVNLRKQGCRIINDSGTVIDRIIWPNFNDEEAHTK